MATKKFASLETLTAFLASLRTTFSPLTHTHKVSDLTDYEVDDTLSSTSDNPISNKAVSVKLDEIESTKASVQLIVWEEND